jgi:hypothetical protein
MEPLHRNKPGSAVFWLTGCAFVALGLATCLPVVCLAFVALFRVVTTTVVQVSAQVVEQVAAQIIEQTLPPILAIVDFEEDLLMGNTMAAYDMTTEDFQTKWRLEDFAALVEAYPELQPRWNETDGVVQVADSLTYTLTSEGDDGRPFTFKLVLRKQKEKWLVDEIIMPGMK